MKQQGSRWGIMMGSLLLVAGSVGMFSYRLPESKAPSDEYADVMVDHLYDSLGLGMMGLSRDAYGEAVRGFTVLESTGSLSNDRLLSIIDFSLPSFAKRFFVIDMVSRKLLFNTYVAHGRNSGAEFATSFSNQPNSLQSSVGFFVTGDTYRGRHGYSLRLQGMEPGINDRALSRGIVMHAASYVNAKMAQQMGTIGRSEGCPAIPAAVHRAIIGRIKQGSCLFIFSPDKDYPRQSVLLQEHPAA